MADPSRQLVENSLTSNTLIPLHESMASSSLLAHNKNTTPSTNTINDALLSRNMYAALSDDDDDMMSNLSLEFVNKRQSENSTKAKKRKIQNPGQENGNSSSKSSKPPPIFLKGISRADVEKILSSLDAERRNYLSKNLPDGIKVFAADTANYKLLREYLQANQAKFQTHLLREEQTTKVVLHGLHEMALSELKLELSRFQIFPVDIKTMNIRQKLYGDQCTYLLYFKKIDHVKISKLRETTAICYTRVRWEYYSNRRKGPLQCSNCMAYGHGGRCCFLDPRCIRCGQSHKSSECPLLDFINPQTNEIEKRNRIPENLLKCGLCGQNHAANFANCEMRKQFVERQQKYRQRTQKQPKVSQSPQWKSFDFPTIPQVHRNGNGTAWSNYLYEPPSIQQQPQMRDPRRNQSQNGDLFSPDELLNIFRELMSTLKTAQSREDQIYVLGQLVIKHCYGSR
jgi:hypothetical protein